MEGNEEQKFSNKYRFAIASKTGVNVDLHFGHADTFYIYEYVSEKACFIEKRNVLKYCAGTEECDNQGDKFSSIIKAIEDCNALLVVRIGIEPSEKLLSHGIKVFQMYEPINNAIVLAVKKITEE